MAGLIQIFYQPGKVFEYVREKRAWAVALIANIILAVAFSFVMYQGIGAANMARTQVEASSAAKTLTPAEIDQRVAMASSPMVEGIIIGSIGLGTGVFMLIFALLFMLIAGMSNGPISFSQALGTAAYAAWPIALVKSALSTLVIFISTDRSELDSSRLFGSNVAFFLDKGSTPKPLYALATSFDLLIIAQIFLAAWGLSVVAKIKFGKSLGGAIGIWVLLTLIAMLISLKT
jgi:hypothetical protein